jgi:hypothetical protein
VANLGKFVTIANLVWTLTIFLIKVLGNQAGAFSAASPSTGTAAGAGAPPVVGLKKQSCFISLDQESQHTTKSWFYTYRMII